MREPGSIVPSHAGVDLVVLFMIAGMATGV